MNRLIVASLLSAAAVAAHAQSFIDNARVRSVQPQYENVTVPRTVCHSEWIQEPRRVGAVQSYGGAVIGGVAGGILGNQVGKGHGREAATAVGAVVGALAGNHIGNQGGAWGPGEPREVRRCQAVNEVESRLTGYRVDYDYRGQTYTTVTAQDPGQYLPVRVSIEPVIR
jgi:uncharacterized protein YcfJ